MHRLTVGNRPTIGSDDRVCVKKQKKRVPPILMHGPQPISPNYSPIFALANSAPIRLDNASDDTEMKEKLNEAIHGWRTLARTELTTLSQEDLAYRRTHFATKPTAGKNASPWGGSSSISAVWRGIAKRTGEIAILIARPALDPAQKKMIHMHMRAINKSIELVPKSNRPSLDAPFRNFAEGTSEAIIRKSVPWLSSLCRWHTGLKLR